MGKQVSEKQLISRFLIIGFLHLIVCQKSTKTLWCANVEAVKLCDKINASRAGEISLKIKKRGCSVSLFYLLKSSFYPLEKNRSSVSFEQRAI